MEKEERVYLGAHIPRGSAIHKALVREQERTGQSVAAILRDALAIRYGLKDNGKEAQC